MTRMGLVGILIVALLMALPQASATADDRKAAVLFQAAQVKDTILGDVPAAIALYQQAIDAAGARGPIAAKALLAMGIAYENDRPADARVAFERIGREFGDQGDVARDARTRLAALTRREAPLAAQVVPRPVLTESVGAVSPDGRLVVTASNGDLLVRDIVTNRPGVRIEGRPSARPGRPVFSADGRSLAYTVFEGVRQSLAVVSTEPGSTPKSLVIGTPIDDLNDRLPTAQRQIISPVGFSPDGRSILTEFHPLRILSFTPVMNMPGSQLAWVSVSDGSVQVVKSFPAPKLIEATIPRLSPDGRFVAYLIGQWGPQCCHIAVLDLLTHDEVEVVKIAGNNRQPRWTPDNAHLLFSSDRSGEVGLWSVPLNGGKAIDEPIQLHVGLQDAVLHGVTQSGTLLFERRKQPVQAVLVAERSASGGRVTQSFLGDSVAWSPNGRRLAYNKVGAAGATPELVIRSLDTGTEQVYQRPGGIGALPPRWFHESERLLLFNNPQATFLTANLADGTFGQSLPRDAQGHSRSGVVAISPDDKTIYALIGRTPNGPHTGLVAVDLSTGVERLVFSFPNGALPRNGQPAIALSPDGSTLALMTVAAKENEARISTVRVDGSGYRDVYGPFPAFRIPDLLRWTRDGRDLVYVESERDAWRVMRIPAAGGQPQPEGISSSQLNSSLSSTPRLGSVGSLDLSPDGSRLALAGQIAATSEVWAIDNIMALVGGKR